MREFAFTVHGLRISVILETAIGIRDIFPTFHSLFRQDRVEEGWRIEVTSVADARKALPHPPASASFLRMAPDLKVSCWSGRDGSFYASLEGALLRIRSDEKRAAISFPSEVVHHPRHLASLALAEIFRYEGFYLIHAGAVEIPGGAVLICGPSGMGKSTFTASWACLGRARFMAEDICLVFRREGVPWVGGILTSLGLTAESESILKNRGVRLPPPVKKLNGKNLYDSRQVFGPARRQPSPLRAIIFLTDDSEDRLEVRKCEPEPACHLILKSSFYAGPRPVMRDHFEMVFDLASHAPTYLVPRAMEYGHFAARMEKLLALESSPASRP